MHADHEAEPVVHWLQGLGLTASVLRYPVGVRHPGPLAAVRAEIAARRRAGAARVGVLGFSAGGHLAGHAALAPDPAPDERPDFALLCYPVVSMELVTHQVSQDNLLGPSPEDGLRRATSLDRLVSAAAPPFFIWHTAADEAVPVEHSYRLASALAAAQVPHDLHVFADGPHGIGLAVGAGDADQWPALAARWLLPFQG